MCVPGPGRYLLVGPRRWPGRARVGRVIVVGFVVLVCERYRILP